MSTLVLYHKNCVDGFLGSLFARKRFPEAELVPVEYGKAPPRVDGRDVYILDFCYDRSTLLDLYSKAQSLKVLDHHISAKERCSDLDFCLFDLEKSGASLSYYFFRENDKEPTPLLVALVEFRDLGFYYQSSDLVLNFTKRYKDLVSKNLLGFLDQDKKLSSIYSYLDSFPYDYEIFEDLLRKLDTLEGLNEAILVGEGVLRYKNNLIQNLMKHKQTLTLDQGLTFQIINSPILQSDLGNILSKNGDIGMVWYSSEEQVRCSLRSSKDGLDVSKLASLLGGGGHKNAAGFSFNNDFILEKINMILKEKKDA